MEIITFFRITEKMETEQVGILVISPEENSVAAASGEKNFKKMVEEEISKGVFNRLTRKINYPKDGDDFIRAILFRYSGNQFWAHHPDFIPGGPKNKKRKTN